jgi:hypothetical protein
MRTRHGESYSDVHGIWRQMIGRCHNPTNAAFARYGGRGIEVCQEWRDSYERFRDHIGPRPSKRHTIERTDNDRGYEPGNVKWATRAEQARNRRSSRLVTIGSETKPLAAWVDESVVSYATLKARLDAGWDPQRALSVPARPVTRP